MNMLMGRKIHTHPITLTPAVQLEASYFWLVYNTVSQDLFHTRYWIFYTKIIKFIKEWKCIYPKQAKYYEIKKRAQ